MTWGFGVLAILASCIGLWEGLRGEAGSRWFFLGACLFFAGIPFLDGSSLKIGAFLFGGIASGAGGVTSRLRERILSTDKRMEEDALETLELRRALTDATRRSGPTDG